MGASNAARPSPTRVTPDWAVLPTTISPPLSLGAGYRAEVWSWDARAETRFADDEKKWNLLSGFIVEPIHGLGLSAGVKTQPHRGGPGAGRYDRRHPAEPGLAAKKHPLDRPGPAGL